jgi:hypothetical protein
MKAEYRMGTIISEDATATASMPWLAAAGYNVWLAPSASCGYEKLSVQCAPTYPVSGQALAEMEI